MPINEEVKNQHLVLHVLRFLVQLNLVSYQVPTVEQIKYEMKKFMSENKDREIGDNVTTEADLT